MCVRHGYLCSPSSLYPLHGNGLLNEGAQVMYGNGMPHLSLSPARPIIIIKPFVYVQDFISANIMDRETRAFGAI